MTVKCACQNCRGSISFDAADFAELNRTSTRIIGQNVRCPHCGYATALTMSIAKWAKTTTAETVHVGRTILAILALLAFLVSVFIIVALVRSGMSIHQIVTGSAGVPGTAATAIAATFGIVLGAMWLVFPWLVWSFLAKIHADLEKIEENTRHGAVEVFKS